MSARVVIGSSVTADLRLMRARLAPGHFQLTIAETGHDALRIAQKWRPDVMLLGGTMPDIGTLEVCRRIKSDLTTSDTLVVLAAAPGGPDHGLRGFEAGADDFLSKSMEFEALPRRVRGLVRLKRMTDEWRVRSETASELNLTPKFGPAPMLSGARALIINDREAEAKLLQEWLSRDGILADLDGGAYSRQSEIAASNFDLVVLGLALTGHDPHSFLSRLWATDRALCTPLLLLADGADGGHAGGFDAGQNDWVLRPLAEAELRARARNQILMGLYRNRLRADLERNGSGQPPAGPMGIFDQRYARHHLHRLLTASGGRDLAALLIDVDQLSRINESRGRADGDRILVAVAQTLRGNVRVFDTLARYSGGKFIVLMPGTTLAEATGVGERLRDAIAAMAPMADAQDPEPRLTVSVGVAAGTGASLSVDTLLHSAESALAGAKRCGRNRVELAGTVD